MKAAIVVPTIRKKSLGMFLQAWRDEFSAHDLIVVEDNPEPTFEISYPNVTHYSWKDIDKEFGRESWIFPRRTDCIRSYGFYKAYQRRSDMIVRLSSPARNNAWTSTGEGLLPRGIPYGTTHRELKCVVSHGLWTKNPDYDAVTELLSSRDAKKKFAPIEQVIPRGLYFPMCGMNLAWRPEITPVMYFLLMGKDWPYDRFGDIWCGILVKRICDHLGYGIKSGEPFVEHRKASSLWANLVKEAAGYQINQTLWQLVDSAPLTARTFTGAYRELSEKLDLPGDYWKRLRMAMQIWSEIFQNCHDAVVPTAWNIRSDGKDPGSSSELPV